MQLKQPGTLLATPASTFDLVLLAASAGGLNALTQVLSALPASFPAAVVVVQHLSPQDPGLMAGILGRRTRLPVKQAEEGEYFEIGKIYLAPPDRHLIIQPDGAFSLSRSAPIHFVRPAANLLFESAAVSFKQRAIAVVLSGMGKDGAAGVQAIKRMGGLVVAQDRATSSFFGMPGAAIDTGDVDLVLPLEEISSALVNLVLGKRPDEH